MYVLCFLEVEIWGEQQMERRLILPLAANAMEEGLHSKFNWSSTVPLLPPATTCYLQQALAT